MLWLSFSLIASSLVSLFISLLHSALDPFIYLTHAVHSCTCINAETYLNFLVV
uniref:Uncharacterized protein n=1 Tax=Rhizophora mucronata TaxID=61149 RepID=A0A2P2NVI5_RHIMU